MRGQSSDIPGPSGVDEGVVVGAAVFSFLDNDNNLPAGADNEVLSFRFEVSPDTEADATELVFVDGGRISGQPVVNMLTVLGTSVLPETESGFILLGGLVKIRLDTVRFIRGDSNGDLEVDLTDAEVTLGYLFLGTDTPHCLDASDFNDDGQLDLTDPIGTLQFLYQGAAPPPAPYPSPGEDETEDPMICLDTGT